MICALLRSVCLPVQKKRVRVHKKSLRNSCYQNKSNKFGSFPWSTNSISSAYIQTQSALGHAENIIMNSNRNGKTFPPNPATNVTNSKQQRKSTGKKNQIKMCASGARFIIMHRSHADKCRLATIVMYTKSMD